MNHSICWTFLLLVQPVEPQVRWQVSGMAVAGSGPSARNSSRMSWRHSSLAANQSATS